MGQSLSKRKRLSKSDLICPIFIRDGENIIEPIPSMPGINRYSIDTVIPYVEKLINLGIFTVALFPLTPSEKNPLLVKKPGIQKI